MGLSQSKEDVRPDSRIPGSWSPEPVLLTTKNSSNSSNSSEHSDTRSKESPLPGIEDLGKFSLEFKESLDLLDAQLKTVSVPAYTLFAGQDVMPFYTRALDIVHWQSTPKEAALLAALVRYHACTRVLVSCLDQYSYRLRLFVQQQCNSDGVDVEESITHGEAADTVPGLTKHCMNIAVVISKRLSQMEDYFQNQSKHVSEVLAANVELSYQAVNLSKQLIASEQKTGDELRAQVEMSKERNEAVAQLHVAQEQRYKAETERVHTLNMVTTLQQNCLKLNIDKKAMQEGCEAMKKAKDVAQDSLQHLQNEFEALRMTKDQAEKSLHQLQSELGGVPSERNPRVLQYRYNQLVRERKAEAARQVALEEDGKSLRKQVEDLTAELESGRAEIQSAATNNKELMRLKAETKAMNNLKVECDRLKEMLKDSHVKHLEEQLRRSRCELDEMRVANKETKTSNMKGVDTRTLSENVGVPALAAPKTDGNKSFLDASAHTLHQLRASLTALDRQMTGMSDDQVGLGWGIVERAESMVTSSSAAMISEIDRCLALRGDAGRRQDLDQTACSALHYPELRGIRRQDVRESSRFSVLAHTNHGPDEGGGDAKEVRGSKVLRVLVDSNSNGEPWTLKRRGLKP